MVDFFAGCLGGLSGIIVGYPFDTIKVRLQGQDPLQKKYTSTWNCFSQIVKNESIFGLYKGITSPLYGQVAINAIIFGVYGNVLRQLHQDNAKTQFIAGAAAGAVQSIVCSPVELVKIRLQMQVERKRKLLDSSLKTDRYKYANTKDCILKIYKHENGIRGLFKGLNATLWREVPSFGFYFSSYNYLCDKTGAIYNGDIKIGRLLFCGGIAGIISWMSTYPFDVIKTRQQADGKMLYNGILDCAVKSYKQEGLVTFFRGFNVTLLRAFPGNAATLATVTVFMDFIRNN